jgi:hypothetical protein
MRGLTLIRDQVVQVREPRQKRLLTATGMVNPFIANNCRSIVLWAESHSVLVTGIGGSASTAYRPVFFWNQCRTRVLLAAPTVAVTWSTKWRNRWPSAHAQALALACPVEQGVELCAQGRADRGGDGGKCSRELLECVAEAGTETRPREECAHASGGVVKAIGQHASDALGWLLVDCRAWERLIGLGKGCRTCLLNVAQMPEHTAADNRRQIDLVHETATALFIGWKLGGEGQLAPGEHRAQTLVATRTDQAIESHGGEMVEARAQLHIELAMRGQQGVAGHLGSHLAIAEDDVGQHREHRTTRHALDAPDGEPT